MKQELPNLVDERRFRRREQPEVERDEFGRVSQTLCFDFVQLVDDFFTEEMARGTNSYRP